MKHGNVIILKRRNPNWNPKSPSYVPTREAPPPPPEELLKQEIAADDPDDLVVRICFLCGISTDGFICHTKNCSGDIHRIM